MNDHERELWVMNDEGLYLWFIDCSMSIRRFIREFRVEIDEHIDHALNPKHAGDIDNSIARQLGTAHGGVIRKV